jgi:hypothetical protein
VSRVEGKGRQENVEFIIQILKNEVKLVSEAEVSCQETWARLFLTHFMVSPI